MKIQKLCCEKKSLRTYFKRVLARQKTFYLYTQYYLHNRAEVERSIILIPIIGMSVINHIQILLVIHNHEYYGNNFISINMPLYCKILIFKKSSLGILMNI